MTVSLSAANPPVPPTRPDAGRLARLRAQTRRDGEASLFFYDTHFCNDAVKLLPGEYFIGSEDILILTTLGSCIAVCIWDREIRIGGMNHFLLPDDGQGGGTSGRYGGFAMDLLIAELIKRGATRATMEAKVFGGGAVVNGMNSINVGELNTAFVLDYLRTERIRVVKKDVLGIHPRKLCFVPASGQAMVKRLASGNADALAALERVAASRAAPAMGSACTVNLF